jgi:hypothetical protein
MYLSCYVLMIYTKTFSGFHELSSFIIMKNCLCLEIRLEDYNMTARGRKIKIFHNLIIIFKNVNFTFTSGFDFKTMCIRDS